MLPQQSMETWWYIAGHSTFRNELKWELHWEMSYRADAVTAAAEIFPLGKSGICWLRFLAIYLEWVNNNFLMLFLVRLFSHAKHNFMVHCM